MTPKEKAEELVKSYKIAFKHYDANPRINQSLNKNFFKKCALIAVKNEYHSLREMLFNLRVCRVIESEKVYLHILQQLIDKEQEVKKEIEKL